MLKNYRPTQPFDKKDMDFHTKSKNIQLHSHIKGDR